MKHDMSGWAAQPATPLRLCFLSYRHLSELAASVFAEFASRARIEVVEASFDSALSAAVDVSLARPTRRLPTPSLRPFPV